MSNTLNPDDPCVYLEVYGWIKVNAALCTGNANGERIPDIGGLGGSGVYALEQEDADPIWSENWDAIAPGAYTFGMVDDAGCHSAQTHSVRVPFIRCE